MAHDALVALVDDGGEHVREDAGRLLGTVHVEELLQDRGVRRAQRRDQLVGDLANGGRLPVVMPPARSISDLV